MRFCTLGAFISSMCGKKEESFLSWLKYLPQQWDIPPHWNVSFFYVFSNSHKQDQHLNLTHCKKKKNSSSIWCLKASDLNMEHHFFSSENALIMHKITHSFLFDFKSLCLDITFSSKICSLNGKSKLSYLWAADSDGMCDYSFFSLLIFG